MQKNQTYSVGSVLFIVSFFCLILSSTQLFSQQNYGAYYINEPNGWNYSPQNSNGEYFQFDNNQVGVQVKIRKEAIVCETQPEFNRAILGIIQNLRNTQEYMEQRKQATPYACLGQKNCAMLKVKSRATNQRRFVLTPYVDGKMYEIDISAGQNQTPAPEALTFISQITLDGPSAPIAQTISHTAQNQTQRTPESTSLPKQDDGLSSFKKNKAIAPPATATTISPTSSTSSNNIKTNNTEPSTNQNKTAQNSTSNTNNKPSEFKIKDITVQKPTINKGNIPEIKFSSKDPCAPSNPKEDGLPWEMPKDDKIKLPDGVDAAIPPAIPGLNNLSDMAYNSAVSSAFEAMNLVYGEMSEKEAKAFQAAWTPLFDFPSQEVVDYLNKLNPIVSQFLVCREAYARNMAAIQMVLLDAATAIEFDEQEIWESAMAEASMYSTSLPPLENAMKQLIKKLEAIGNPPNPVAAKCEARRRYNKMFGGKADPTGCWAGFEDNLAISSDELGIVYEPKFEFIYKVLVDGVEKYYSLEVCMDCNIGSSNQRGNITQGDYGDTFVKNNLLSTDKYTGTWIDGPRQGQMSQYIEKCELPNIPDFPETSNERLNGLKEKDKAINKNWSVWEDEFDQMIQSKRVAISFFKTAMEWTEENRWQDYDHPSEGWFCPDDVLVDFWRDMSAGSSQPKQEAENKTPVENQPVASTDDPQSPSELEIEEQNRREAIEFHNEMIGIVKHNLDRELKEREEVIKKLLSSKTKKEAEEHDRRLKDLNFRIIGLQSNIQSEMDLVASYKTGQLVHTRTAFDNYAQHKFINGIKQNIKNIEDTRRIAERIERQIKLLPKEVQGKARDLARETLDGKTIASGDIEKARKLVNTFGKQIEGYAGYDYAMAKEEEAYAEIKEQAAQAGIMVVGVVAVGFGSAALVEAYGAEAAAAIYGPKILGAIYGGTTGLIRGGPKEGLSQALMGYSPNGYALSQFIDGFQNAGNKKDATWSSQAWEGAKQAGYAWCVGKVFELGITGVTKGLLAWRGPNSRLFKPVIQTSAQRSRQLQDVLRSKQQQLDAEDIVQTFETLERELATLRMDEVKNAIKIQQMEDELQQLTASMNASYHAKWQFKYKASPRTMRAFDRRVQQNYANMEPGMVARMDAMGYKMDRVQFKQFRNAGSGGSSSMDLDLVPVQAGSSGKPKTTFMKKDGTVVSAKEFMDDCQRAMNAEYKQLTGISAPASDMNLVTSAHKEAFATSKLLDKNIDMSEFTDEEIASIGKVLRVKAEGIDANKMLTNTNKMQAKARETAKEIENMMLRKLKSDLNNAPAGSAQAREIQNQISYWEKMLTRFKQIGMQESDPSVLMELSNQVRRETGGKDVHAVMDDVARFFGSN